MFSPLELDPIYKGEGITTNQTNSLLLTGVCGTNRPSVLGMRGVEVREGSGEQGYFEVRIIKSAPIFIGLATHEVTNPHSQILERASFAWFCNGEIWSHLPGISDDYDEAKQSARRHRTGDVVGIMVDCTAEPQLRIFVNGVQVEWVAVAQDGFGQVLYPAFCLGNAQICMSSNPDLPTV